MYTYIYIHVYIHVCVYIYIYICICIWFWMGNSCSQVHILIKVKVAQSCPTLCDPMNYIVHRILQARILEWVAFPFSRGSSHPRDGIQVSRIAGGFFSSWATGEAPSQQKTVASQEEQAPQWMILVLSFFFFVSIYGKTLEFGFIKILPETPIYLVGLFYQSTECLNLFLIFNSFRVYCWPMTAMAKTWSF